MRKSILFLLNLKAREVSHKMWLSTSGHKLKSLVIDVASTADSPPRGYLKMLMYFSLQDAPKDEIH